MKKMTVVFDDDALYTTVKVEAARRNQPVKKLISQALTEWLEAQEDAELMSEIEASRTEWRQKGGTEAKEFFAELKAEAKKDAL
jgi:hypothetical protein